MNPDREILMSFLTYTYRIRIYPFVILPIGDSHTTAWCDRGDAVTH